MSRYESELQWLLAGKTTEPPKPQEPCDPEPAAKPLQNERPTVHADVVEELRAAAPQQGEPQRLEWAPNPRFEQMYEDLSDLSSLDGNESPQHREVKEYAATRRAARKTLEPTIWPTEPEMLTTNPPADEDSVGAELVPCARQEAGLATDITKQLQKLLGKEAAKAILSQYTQADLRDQGKKQRYWVDADGKTLRLALQKKVALN